MEMPGRKWQGTSDKYRYGMNTQEKDDEIFEGAMGAKYWEYDSRIGRRWNIDPVLKDWESPYVCFSDNPILISDKDGDDGGQAAAVLMITQEVAVAAAATGIGAAAVPFIEAAGAITALIIVMNDTPISGTAVNPSGTKGKDATTVNQPHIDKKLLEKFGESKQQDLKNNVNKAEGNDKPTKTERMQKKKSSKNTSSKDSEYGSGAEHTKNARPSSKGRHEKGGATNKKNQGGEKADSRRYRTQDSKKKK